MRAGFESRHAAATHLAPVLKGRPFSPITADRLPDSRDRALANRLVTVALRRHGQISAILDECLGKGVPPRSGLCEAALRIGIAQLLHIPEIPAHSALDLAVETVKADRRAARFDRLVNGVLRRVQREAGRFSALPAALLFPDWLAEEWRKAYGDEALSDFADSLLAGAPLDLTLKAPDAELIERLGAVPVLGQSVRIARRDAAVADLPGYAEGAWWVQDAAAALPARLVRAGPGQRVLDLCAAPGGKTAQLASMGAAVTALDLNAERMDRLRDNLARLGLDARTVVADALAYRPDTLFDAVLLDAPCSATGTFRRHPEVLFQRDPKGVAGRAALQKALFSHALDLVRPGGTLVYCVCSLERAEGEAIAAWAAGSHPGLALAPVSPAELDGWAAPITAEGTVRTTPALSVPGRAGGTLDGFFIARFVKG